MPEIFTSDAELAERAAAMTKRRLSLDFQRAEFIGWVQGYRSVRGSLEITIVVEPAEKYHAMPITDGYGHRLFFHVEPVDVRLGAGGKDAGRVVEQVGDKPKVAGRRGAVGAGAEHKSS